MKNYVTFTPDELKELQDLICLYFADLQKQYAPALDLVALTTVEKHAKKFLLERKAVYELDQAAIKQGYDSAAHKISEIEKAKAEQEANERALEEAKQKAIEEAEREEREKQLAEAKRLQDERDIEDARIAAVNKAAVEATKKGVALTGLPVDNH